MGDLVSRARPVPAALPPGEARTEGERALDHADRFARGEPIEPRVIEDCLMNEDEPPGALVENHDLPEALVIVEDALRAARAVVG